MPEYARVCQSMQEYAVHLEGLVDDCKPLIILDILPSSISMAHDPREQPVIMAPVPYFKLPPRHSSLFLILPQCVQLGEAAIRDVELEYELVFHLLDLLLVFLLSLVLGRLLVLHFLFSCVIFSLFLFLCGFLFNFFLLEFFNLVHLHWSTGLLLLLSVHLRHLFRVLRNFFDIIVFHSLLLLFRLRTCSRT